MSREIIGNSYRYIVDEAYGINKDGWIATGTESIVYKGLKTKDGGDLQFSCVLKFKPKKQIIDGRTVDRLTAFKNEELTIFQELRECRSVVRIDDVIDDLGDFRLPCEDGFEGEINSKYFFCVVEEYIDGWNLDEFCREEFWKLRQLEPVANGLFKKVEFEDFSEEDKKAVFASYHYDNQLKYQEQILQFMINLCEIMEFATEQKHILHLDIKPENIMVTRYGKELVLIDFGRSKRVTLANRFVDNPLGPVDYNQKETHLQLHQYGTAGYAAPECYCPPADGSQFPFAFTGKPGKMSIESDIFSFGATFWECLNMFELVTQGIPGGDKRSRLAGGDQNGIADAYDLYNAFFHNDAAYCNRDLSLTTATYHRQLERIIKKCTRARHGDYTTSDKYYHSYRELHKDLELTKDSTPTIVKEENVKAKTAFKLGGVMCAVCLVFLLINGIYKSQDFKIAQSKWNELISNYNETQFAWLNTVATDYITAAPTNRVADTYDEIAKFTYSNNGTISDYEAAMLVELLQEAGGIPLGERIDEIMMHADSNSFKSIVSNVVTLDAGDDSVGYELAVAIYNVEVSTTAVVEAFQTLQKYAYNKNFTNAVIKLRYVLDKDSCIGEIVAATGMTRQEVASYFKSIAQ